MDIEVSVVIPCLNEEKTIGVCLEKVLAAFEKDRIAGEIVVVDNGSTDNSVEIAQSCGARVIHQPVRGYGSAYLMGIEAAKGKYIILGDADDTYDFSVIKEFLTPLVQGYDFVIGTRLKGKIIKGAMPWLHRYIGNPVLTGLLNIFFQGKISDAHCGMRALTKEAYEKLHLKTTGMEFASEMIINALQNKLKIKEVPITYYPRQGKSKLNSFRDGWRHLRFMLLYSPTYLFLIPGAILFFIGLISLLFLLPGPLQIGEFCLDYHYMFIGSLLAILGFQIICLGLYAKSYSLTEHFEKQNKVIERLLVYFNLEKGLVLGAGLTLIGLGTNLYILVHWVLSGFGQLGEIRTGLVALTFTVIGVQTIFSVFFLSLLQIKKR